MPDKQTAETPHARLESRSDGYVRWRAWDPKEAREKYVYVHQLIAVAEGANPEDVFSGGEFHVHHIDGLRWHNAPENVELVHSTDHALDHDHLGVAKA